MPERAYQYEGTQMIRNLNLGAQISQGVLEPLNRQQLFDSFKQRMKNVNDTELVRSGNIPYQPERFIIEARELLRNDGK